MADVAKQALAGGVLGAVAVVNPPLGASLWQAYRMYQFGKSASRIVDEIQNSDDLRLTLARESSRIVLSESINWVIDDQSLSQILPGSGQDLGLARKVFTQALISAAREARKATVEELVSFGVDRLIGDG